MQWLVPISDLQRDWPIYLDYTEDALYVQLADKHHHSALKGMASSQLHASDITSRDNKGVVTRSINQIEYDYNYPYNTLEPDWDVIA
eukprot:10520691-Ditylum_brightwellii.AAC.1